MWMIFSIIQQIIRHNLYIYIFFKQTITQCLIFNCPNYPYQKTKTPQQQQIIKNSNSCSQIKSHFFNKKNHGPLKYNQTPLKLGPQKAQIKTKNSETRKRNQHEIRSNPRKKEKKNI
jgi:hypothetical protein